MSLLVGIALGILTSLAGWWLVTRLPVPRLFLSQPARIPDSGGQSKWRYRVKVVNVSRWPLPQRPAIDARVVATLRVRGLDLEQPVKWNNYNVPIVNEGRVPLLERNTVVALRTERIRLDELPRLASGLQRLGRDVADLDGLLCLGNKAELRVMVTASDAYTHATTTRIACYRKDDIATGPFLDLPGRAGLEVESDNPPVADRPAGIAAVLLIGAPGSGKSSVLGALATRLEIAEVEHGAIESEELARGFPRANASTWIAQLQAALRFQRDSGRRLFLIAATTESDSELRGLIAASKSDLRLVVCLAATADVLAERLQRREPDGWPGKAALIARGREMAERIPALSGIDVRIDTSSGDAAEIAAQIHGEMQRRGLLTAPSEWSAA